MINTQEPNRTQNQFRVIVHACKLASLNTQSRQLTPLVKLFTTD